MATTQELLSLQRKIALDSYHKSIQPINQRKRSRSGADLAKSVKAAIKSRSKDTNHATLSHLPSIPKPFKSVKKIFKRPKQEMSDSQLQRPHKKYKSKSKTKHKNSSESNLSLNLLKLIDKHLIIQYQQYVEERVARLRSRVFPNELIHQLPEYRADLTHSFAQSRLKPQYSRHKECDELIQADLLRAEKHANQRTTKLPKKSSTLNTIKKGIVAPIKPIKNLFQQTKLKTDDLNLELKFNIIPRQHSDSFEETPHPESTASTTEEPKNESIEPTHYSLASISQISDDVANQLISSLNTVHNKMEVIMDNDPHKEETPILQSILPFTELGPRHTIDNTALIATEPSKLRDLRRAETFPIGNETNKLRNDPSPTPPWICRRTPNLRTITDQLFEKIRSNTPSWALRDSSNEENDIIHNKIDNKPTDIDLLESKYSELELLCHDLQITIRTMQQGMDEQNNRINLLTQQLHDMEDELKKVNKSNKETVFKPINKTIKKSKKRSRFINYNFNYSKFWDKFKAKMLKESDIISFERTIFENMYHSLFAYFLNGLMVIWMLIVFLFGCFWCCACKNNGNNRNNDSKYLKLPNGLKSHPLTHRSSSSSRLLKRRNKKKKCRVLRNNNVWRDISDEQDGDSPSSGY